MKTTFGACVFAAAVHLGISTTVAAQSFRNATANVGTFDTLPTWGAQFVDIDADGDVDLLRNFHFHRTNLRLNDGTGRFSLEGVESFASELGDRHGFLWADLDGDGLLDAVCSHGGDGGCGCSDDGNELWKNLGGGVLMPVPDAGGMSDEVGRGRTFSAADVDGDGDLDLHHGKAALARSPNSLYRNDGEMHFVDIASDLGLDEVEGTTGALFADYDDDGDPDLLVGGEEFFRATRLYRNDGATFSEVTDTVFPGSVPKIAGASFGDYDNDGDLDLALAPGYEGIVDSWGMNEDNTELWCFSHHRFQDDGLDIFVFDTVDSENPEIEVRLTGQFDNANIFLGRDKLNPVETADVNDGGGGPGEGVVDGTPGTFRLTNQYVGTPEFEAGVDYGFFCWRVSVDGPWVIVANAPPGRFGNMTARVTCDAGIIHADAVALESLSLTPQSVRLYRNDGGAFFEVTDEAGFTPSANPRDIHFVDFDNDGDLDLHQVNKGTSWTGNEEDILWRNDEGTFVALTGDDWIPGLGQHLSDGATWADFDNDGDLDVFLQEGAPPVFWALRTPAVLYRNVHPENGNHLKIELAHSLWGVTPVGARVTLHLGERQIHRRLSANAWRGFQGPQILHFGLGDATSVDRIEIEHPLGAPVILTDVEANQTILVAAGGGVQVLSQNEGPAPVVAAPWVGSVFPQPSRGMQHLRFLNPRTGRVSVHVYDVAGRRVVSLLDESAPSGEIRLEWDGRANSGDHVPAGVYFIRAEAGVSFQRKVVRLR